MKHNNPERIIVVSGLGRCGSTMTMRMLEAGGVKPFCLKVGEGSRYETPCTNLLPQQFDWLKDVRGKAVKILRPDIYTPPKPMKYDFIYLMRNPHEQAKSQIKFIEGHMRVRQRPDEKQVAERIMEKNVEVIRLLKSYPQHRFHIMRFETTLTDPLSEALRLAGFLELDTGEAMASVVDNRSPECAPGILEGPNPVARGVPAREVTLS